MLTQTLEGQARHFGYTEGEQAAEKWTDKYDEDFWPQMPLKPVGVICITPEGLSEDDADKWEADFQAAAYVAWTAFRDGIINPVRGRADLLESEA